MNPDRLAAISPESMERVQRLDALLSFSALIQLELIISLTGTALLALLLAPARHRRAAQRLGTNPGRCYLLGVALGLLPVVALGLLWSAGIPRGQPLLLGLITVLLGAGASVAARQLGHRVIPTGHALAQTGLGLLAILLPLAFLPGAIVVLVAAPLGLGAWVSAGSSTAPLPGEDA